MPKNDNSAITKLAGLAKKSEQMQSETPLPAENQSGSYVAPSRQGTKALTVHVPENIAEAMRVLAFETKTPKQALMMEALELLFQKKGVRIDA
ncbi:MAG: ribbon-helix-helix domain-containing protein [Pseudomonadales bacterium]